MRLRIDHVDQTVCAHLKNIGAHDLASPDPGAQVVVD
jgi:hypothetical protein